ARSEPTVPTTLARELATNPFLRADAPEIMAKWGNTSPEDAFAALRLAKDSF
ncbi:MAG: hydroxyacylglutathione hydrolase C-terminal domain-containing protein, partial [Pseudomonadota bacterium]